ncbi:DUF4395 domain-containing protein [Prolixibacter sp. NT017]|uniref:DUF4395 domain-containing protein n=1 Tax=Prolixibacter sp. NT017 TaxID=2652390 RepID=UPI00127A5B10|nr:DUF4395 domain-containing protein [Prolixibacter sp. NT017]GET24432.1 hypothetical protein NT017_07610 [Prolixibacter sp. NT017]
MKTYAICPISDKKINERVARVNGAFTVLLLILFGFTGQWFIPAFLAVDFLMRSGNFSKYSILGNSSKSIVKWLPIEEQLINAGPKIFAARIGFIFSLVIFLTAFLGLNLSSIIVAGILSLFSFLEAVFGICVACKLYPYVYKVLY